MQKKISKIVIAFLIIVCAWYGKNLDTWGKNKVIDNDVVSYYAYLPATLIFHDLGFSFLKDLPPDFEGKIWVQEAPSGKPVLRMTMGLSLLWLPFFTVAHLAAKAMGGSALGYSWPYSLSIFVAAVFYLFLGLFYLRKILLVYFSETITGITLLLIVLGTNLMYYVISEPGMSHVYSFALITIFLYYTLQWVEKPGFLVSAVLGFLGGLIILIRPVNGLVLVFPLLVSVRSFSQLVQRIGGRWKQIAWAGIVALLVVTPQLVYWKTQTGHFVFNSYMDSGRFYFLKPHILNGLFSFRKGWLIYTPLMIFAVFGLLVMKKYAGGLRLATVVFLALFIYVVFSWWCWWYGGSFGSRPMIETYGILAVPLAASLSVCLKNGRWKKIITGIFLFFFILLNQFQMKQYRTSLLHWDSMTRKAYQSIFFNRHWPEGYEKLIQAPDYEKALKGEKEYGY